MYVISCLFNPISFHIYKESFAVQFHLCFTIFIKIAGVIIYKRNNFFLVLSTYPHQPLYSVGTNFCTFIFEYP